MNTTTACGSRFLEKNPKLIFFLCISPAKENLPVFIASHTIEFLTILVVLNAQLF